MLWVILLCLLWGPEAQGDFQSAGVQLGGLWNPLWRSTEPLLSLVSCFDSLRLARLVLVLDHTMLSRFLGLLLYLCQCVSPLSSRTVHLGSLHRRFGVAAIFRFLLFLQGFHNWTLNPFHMMGVAGILGGALLCQLFTEPLLKIPSTKMANNQTLLKRFDSDSRRRNVFNGYREPLLVANLWRCF